MRNKVAKRLRKEATVLAAQYKKNPRTVYKKLKRLHRMRVKV